MKLRFVGLGVIFGLAASAPAIQVVSESTHTSCTPFEFQRELRIYKDPSFFVPDLGLMYDSPILTTVKGSTHLMILGSSREFKNFGEVSKLYEIVDPQFRSENKEKKSATGAVIIPIKICGQSEPYSDSLGFVLESDLKTAQTEDLGEGGKLPPSTAGRPIPKLPKNLQE